ncbi:ATP-grasp domain-containing protein [Gaetbulibacter sp. M235]|uniref:ATP-grasp domain-containing protein n=1 Tax=Gaetbulibacter sp. M235 TaxID=3126510 RepID=UPI00374F852E
MKNHITPFSVLVLEDNINLFVFVVHCLSQIKGINIYVLSNKKDAETRYSRKIKKYIFYNKPPSELEWISNIDFEVDKHHIDLVMPVNEYEIETLLKYQDQFKNRDKLVILPTLDDFYKANDKGLLAEHLKKNQISTPKSFLIKAGEKNINDENLRFPILVKPTTGFYGGDGIIKFNDVNGVKLYLNNNNLSYDILLEEYVEGYDLCCNILCKKGEILAFTIQKGLLWTEKPFSPQIALEFIYDEKLYDTVKKLMKSLNWSGVANIDIRFDYKTKQFMILEINPRFWLSTEASEMAGVNFPYLLCLSSLNADFELPNYKHKKILNLKGLSYKTKMNKFFVFKFKFICNNTPIKYYLKDPFPLIYIMSNKIKSMMKN